MGYLKGSDPFTRILRKLDEECAYAVFASSPYARSEHAYAQEHGELMVRFESGHAWAELYQLRRSSDTTLKEDTSHFLGHE